MDEGELWVAILEAIGRHALDCAAEIRSLRAQLGDTAATRGESPEGDDASA